MKPFKGKIAIVTGANRGIGKAIAMKLAEGGASVVITARDAELSAAVVQEIEAGGGKALAVAIDLRLPESAAKVVEATVAAFGGIDIVVNNAGATKLGEFEKLTDDDFLDGFALKYFAGVRMTRAAWPYLKARSGSLMNIVGVGGRAPGPLFSIGGSVNAAILSFTKSIAELGTRDGVQVNVVNPGPVRTSRFEKRLEGIAAAHGVDLEAAADIYRKENRLARIGRPEDIANLVAFVVGPEGRYMQGSLVDMDGGQNKSV